MVEVNGVAECEYGLTPCWGPLIDVLMERFMYMGTTTCPAVMGKRRIHMYKHVWTRRYLNIDDRGFTYQWKNGKYCPVNVDEAIAHVFS